MQDRELKAALKKFDSLINDLPDERRFIHHYKNFIINFLRIKTGSTVLPTAEIMAIIKHEKPIIFSIMKNEFSNNLVFNIVTKIDMEYQEGYKRISELKQRL